MAGFESNRARYSVLLCQILLVQLGFVAGKKMFVMANYGTGPEVLLDARLYRDLLARKCTKGH